MDPFVNLDAVAQAQLVRSGEVAPIELVDAAIARIEELDPLLNCVVIRDLEAAREAARVVDRNLPLAGVPFLVKDLVAGMAGLRQTEGSRFLADHVAKADSHLVARYRRAGLILLGRTNTPEFGNMATTEGALHGTCVNPWDPAMTPGGSSGGSAAAVASGLVPMAHANDGGGSIRIPAACTGTFGLKPTRGRTSLGPQFGDLFAGLIVEHAITRTVRDSAALLDVGAGPELGDPYSAPAPHQPFLASCVGSRRRLRIGVWESAPEGIPTDARVKTAVLEVASLCEQLGHRVEVARPEFPHDYLDTFYEVWADSNAYLVRRWQEVVGRVAGGEDLEPLTASLREVGEARSASDHMMSVERMQSAGRRFARWFGENDIWLTLTLTRASLPLGSFSGAPDAASGDFAPFSGGEFAPYTALANISGLPAVSMPVAQTPDGWPVGVQLFAPHGEEGILFGLAAELEAERPWASRWPPLSAHARRPRSDDHLERQP